MNEKDRGILERLMIRYGVDEVRDMVDEIAEAGLCEECWAHVDQRVRVVDQLICRDCAMNHTGPVGGGHVR